MNPAHSCCNVANSTWISLIRLFTFSCLQVVEELRMRRVSIIISSIRSSRGSLGDLPNLLYSTEK